jgi:hypothetical protein
MRAPAALVSTALVLSGFRTVGAEPCPPRATLDGDGAAVARVADELRRLGVKVSSEFADDGCSTVRAQVAVDTTGGIAVAVRGASRGSEGRVVSDAALAAAWIDSWTREDFDLRPPAPRVASVQPSILPSVPPSDVAPAVGAAAPTSSRWDRFAVSASYAQTWSDDDATWKGLDVAACVRVVGGFCVGGSVRAAFDGERLVNATGVARSDLSLLALARYPVALGRMSIAPELGVGVGRLATRRAESTCKPVMMPPPNCNPMTDPMCVPQTSMCEPNEPGTTMSPKYYVGDDLSVATYAPRIALALRIAVPLFEHVWLDGLAGYTYAPFAHGSVFEAAADVAIAPELIALPGEPSSGYAIGIGLRVGSK